MFRQLNKYVLATDLDGTIVHDDIPHAPLWQELAKEQASLIYITGRTFSSAQLLIQQANLPTPDVLICDVGGAIYDGHTHMLDETWARHVLEANFSEVAQIAEQYFTPQPVTTPFRLAYYGDEQAVEAFKQQLSPHAAIDVIHSSNRDVDIMRRGVDKAAALEYVLATQLEPSRVIVAGDSENDYSLFISGHEGIAVANACDTLYALAHQPHIYIAQQQGAAGVLEGWRALTQKEGMTFK